MSGRAAGAGAGLRGVDSGTHSVSLRASERARKRPEARAGPYRPPPWRSSGTGRLSKKSSRGGVHSNSGPIYHQKTPAVELPLPLAKARYLSINRQPELGLELLDLVWSSKFEKSTPQSITEESRMRCPWLGSFLVPVHDPPCPELASQLLPLLPFGASGWFCQRAPRTSSSSSS